MNLQSELREHLNNGETLLWTGVPKRGLVFRMSDFLVIPFSLLWCGFAIFWFITASKGGGLFALFGVPFVAVGLYQVFGRFITDSLQRKNTVYGLTENRIIIKSGIFSTTIDSINIKNTINVSLNENKNGIGTIIIGDQQNIPGFLRGLDNSGHLNGSRLEMIKNARKVYNQIVVIAGND